MVGFRPEDLRLTSEAAGVVTVDVVKSLGANAYVYGHVDATDGTSEDIIVRADGRIPNHQHFFHAKTGTRLAG